MSGLTYPDYVDALIDHLRNQEVLTNVVGAARIVTEIKAGTDMTRHNHLVLNKAGRVTTAPPVGTISPRIDALAFGTTGHESMRIIRALRTVLTPVDGRTRFVSKGVIYDSVWTENEPIQLETPENWPYVLNTFGAIVLRAAVPVEG